MDNKNKSTPITKKINNNKNILVAINNKMDVEPHLEISITCKSGVEIYWTMYYSNIEKWYEIPINKEKVDLKMLNDYLIDVKDLYPRNKNRNTLTLKCEKDITENEILDLFDTFDNY